MSYVVFGFLAEISLTVYATASVCGKKRRVDRHLFVL